ncbi:MAG: hypothetical protein DYG98_12865 [Haliscomenobacteraceae bacterium CHB4]|nr:hypothetical protein [Saprospiraceae bacterium]MCE7923942.1 hypothetical protein [Haliscomenobacteraceae bacterium CHB4]
MHRKIKTRKSGLKKTNNTPAVTKLAGLIRSLTRTQKRDFKKYIKFWSGRKAGKYVLLFDAVQKYIGAGKKEDELTAYLLKHKKLALKPAVMADRTKYLYRKILESMRTTPDAAPHLNRLNALMQDIVFLYSKNLFNDARALVREGRQLAQDLDKPAYLLELNFWNKRLDTTLAFPTDALDKWRNMQEGFLQNLEDSLDYDALAVHSSYFFLAKKLPENWEARILNLMTELKNGLDEKLSIRMKINLYIALSHYYELKYILGTGKSETGLVKKANMKQSLDCQEKVLDAFRTNKIYLEEEQTQFVNVVGDYINRCLRFGQTEPLEQLESELSEGRNELIKYRNLAFIRLQHHLTLNEFRKARDYFEKNRVAEGVEKFGYRMPENRLLALRFTAGQIYYSLDDFDRAGSWFSKIARMRVEIRPDAVLVCKILEIICLWEYGTYRNNDPVRPVKNLRRSLRRTHLINTFITKILDAVEMVFRSSPRGLKKAGFPALLSDIKNDYEADKTKALYSMLLAWFDAKLNRTSVNAEIIKFK